MALEVLEHHARYISEAYPHVVSLGEAEELVRNIIIPKLTQQLHFDGELKYPRLEPHKVIQNLSPMIVAVNTGCYIPLAEMKPRGGCNTDGMCRSCGNLLVEENGLTTSCDIDRRDADFFLL